jgi:hypothetical protein
MKKDKAASRADEDREWFTFCRCTDTGEFVHPNVIYSMEIDAKVRRLVVGAALGNAG